jgi:hypothetical protein
MTMAMTAPRDIASSVVVVIMVILVSECSSANLAIWALRARLFRVDDLATNGHLQTIGHRCSTPRMKKPERLSWPSRLTPLA